MKTSSAKPMQVSIVIATYNRAEMACRCVASALASDWPNLEIVVVSDHSPDDTVARLKERFGKDSRLKVFENPVNLQSGGARNRGASLATGEFLFFVDDDNVLAPTTVRALVGCFERDPQLGLAAPVAVNRTDEKDGLIWTLGSDFNRWTSQPKDYRPDYPVANFKADRETYPTTYSPNAYMVRHQAFLDVHGFDESFGIMFDESDFGWRIMERGWKGCICAAARTDHYGQVEKGCAPQLRHLGIERPRRAYLFGRNRLWFAKRHFSSLQVLSVMFVFAPLSAAYYAVVALRNRRPDIAWSYVKGTVVGWFASAPCRKERSR